MKKYKISIIVYLILLIIFIFLFSIYFQQSLGDIIWNYSFSHAIRLGEIPYKDFNIISTPLYSFIMSIGLFIYDDILTISIESGIGLPEVASLSQFALVHSSYPGNSLIL